jgi:SRSO17 transposase
MLPDCRSIETFSVPKFELNREDIDNIEKELKEFQTEFHDCFIRSESRENFFQYAVGQISVLDRKSIEPMAINVEGAKVRPLQRFVSDTHWDDDKIEIKYRNMVNEDLGDEKGVLIFDESGFPKKGNFSAGVGRQYCGNIGKVDNSQVGVFAAYASPKGYALVDRELYIPEQWFSDDYAKKREKCRFPENLEFKTKPELAIEMFRKIKAEETLPFKYVTADSIYGENPTFISAVEECRDLVYFVSVGNDTSFWLQQPKTMQKEYKHKGETKIKEVVPKTEKTAITAKDFAKSLHDTFWYRRKVSEGTKGPIEYEFTKRRVVLSKEGLPQKTVWLVVKRTITEEPTYSFYLSNAPINSRLPLFVWLSGMRWPIEQCFEEAKSEIGMDQYEVRKYAGWYHHMMLSMLTHFFLWHLKIRWGKKSAISYDTPS